MNKKIDGLLLNKGFSKFTPSNASAGFWYTSSDVNVNMKLCEEIWELAQKDLMDKIINEVKKDLE